MAPDDVLLVLSGLFLVAVAYAALDARRWRGAAVEPPRESTPAPDRAPVDRISASAPVVRDVDELAAAPPHPRGAAFPRLWRSR